MSLTQRISRFMPQPVKQSMKRVLQSETAQTLASPHSVDRYLELFDPAWSLQDVRATVTNVRRQTADTVTLTLRPNSNWTSFVPGQFVQVTVEIEGARHTRCYSPANSLHRKDGQIELTAKTHANGFVSKYLRDHVCTGDVLILSQADGEFALPAERPDRVLLISGGSGITPVMSMLRTLCDEGHKGAITFLHYANTLDDMLYVDELAALDKAHDNVTVLRCFNNDDRGELQGLFSLAHLQQAVPDFADAQAFLCGPPPMMNAVEATWQECGIENQLFKESFSADPIVVDSDSAEGEVRFRHSERLAVNNGDTLLVQAESAGLTPKYGCRMGICHACTCKKVSGQVRDVRNGQLSGQGEEDIRICVSVPVGTVTLEL